MDNKNEIGKFIRRYRNENDNITLRELSNITGISFSHLSKIERGEHIPSKTTLNILAEKLDLDKDKLYLMSGYAPSDNFDNIADEEEKRLYIMRKIAKEFPDADLMFDNLAKFTSEQLKEVYDFIKFKSQQNK